MIRRDTIDLLLLSQGVEKNPGPDNNKPNLTVRTYNCNGLGDREKRKRVLRKVREEVSKGGIVLLQETHVEDETLIGIQWNLGYVTSCVSTQSAGVIILFDNSYECHETYKDHEGRIAIAVIENNIEKLIVVNIYAPCDPVAALVFMEAIFT